MADAEARRVEEWWEPCFRGSCIHDYESDCTKFIQHHIDALTTCLHEAKRALEEKSYLWKPRQRTVCTCFHMCPENRREDSCVHAAHCELETEQRVAALEGAITYLFTPGPGIAVPEPYPENETYEPHKKTWNDKLAKLRAVMPPAPKEPSTGESK